MGTWMVQEEALLNFKAIKYKDKEIRSLTK